MILLRKVNFAFVIPNPILNCSYVVLNFWTNLNLVLMKLFLLKKCVYVFDYRLFKRNSFSRHKRYFCFC